MSEIHVLPADGSVGARVGDLVVVHLAEPGATGYQWTAHVAGDAVVEESTDLTVPREAPPGRAGERTFGFRAASRGTATVTLVLARAWEDGAAAERHEIGVTVTT